MIDGKFFEHYMGVFTGWTPTACKNTKEVRYYSIEEGQLVYFYNKNKKRVAHVGIIIKVLVKNGYTLITTVEGNTENPDGREGVFTHNYTITRENLEKIYYIREFLDVYNRHYFTTCAKKYVGTLEGRNNDNMFGKYFELNNMPYCQFFVNYVFLESQKKNGQFYYNDQLYYNLNGYIVKDNLIKLYNGLVYFDENGIGTVGWKKINNKWYYFHDNYKAVCDDWLLYLENWYYFNKKCQMLQNEICEIEGKQYYFDSKGKCVENGKVKYNDMILNIENFNIVRKDRT